MKLDKKKGVFGVGNLAVSGLATPKHLTAPPYAPEHDSGAMHPGVRHHLHIFGHALVTAARCIPSPSVFLTGDTEISGDTAWVLGFVDLTLSPLPAKLRTNLRQTRIFRTLSGA